jgi:hypothetical protein
MDTPTDTTASPGSGGQRRELEDSLETSTQRHPETFRDQANEEKRVEIPPDKTRAPIRGIDAPERPGR